MKNVILFYHILNFFTIYSGSIGPSMIIMAVSASGANSRRCVWHSSTRQSGKIRHPFGWHFPSGLTSLTSTRWQNAWCQTKTRRVSIRFITPPSRCLWKPISASHSTWKSSSNWRSSWALPRRGIDQSCGESWSWSNQALCNRWTRNWLVLPWPCCSAWHHLTAWLKNFWT